MYRLYIRKFNKAVSCLCIVVALILSVTLTTTSFSASSKENTCYEQTGKLLVSQTPQGVSSIGGEWLVIGLARGNISVSKNYYADYKEKVIDIIKGKDGVLSSSKYSEYSRVILALTSIGEDVTDVGGYNLLSYLSDFTKVKRQGINGPIWALIALDSNNYSIPKGESTDNTTRERLIDYILGKELSTGGWTLAGNTPDPDVTAMAVTALSKYYNSNKEVKSAVDKGITVLSDIQKSSGNFSSGGVINSESVSQVIVCLSSLGINPDTDKRFICDGKSLVDVLLSFSVSGGGFAHQKGGEYNQMATEQGFYALVAYERLLLDKTSLFDMTDVFKSSNSDDNKTNQNNTNQNSSKNTSNNNSTNSKSNSSSKSKNSVVNSSSNNTAKTVTNQGNEKDGNGATLNSTNAVSEENSNDKNTESTSLENEKSKDENIAVTSENSLQNEEQANSLEENSTQQNDEKKQDKDTGILVYIIIGVSLLLAFAVLVLIVRKRRKSKVVKGEE
ncbi:MAG: prenyltransferase/squalene oxidase repeat-containing protein [Ruminococcus sp.]